MKTRGFVNKFGTLFDGIRHTSHKQGTLFFLSFFYIRRFTLAAVVVFIQTQFLFQIFAFIITTLVKLGLLLALKPYISPKLQRIEANNEVFTLLIIYHMICFTDWIPSVTMKFYIGYSCVAVNCLLLLINLILMLKSTIKRVYYRIKLFYLLKIVRVRQLK